MKQISKEEFSSWIKSYPNKLDTDVIMFCEPPYRVYYDFSLAEGWDAMVAKVCLNTAMEGHPAYKGEPNEYFVLEDI